MLWRSCVSTWQDSTQSLVTRNSVNSALYRSVSYVQYLHKNKTKILCAAGKLLCDPRCVYAESPLSKVDQLNILTFSITYLVSFQLHDKLTVCIFIHKLRFSNIYLLFLKVNVFQQFLPLCNTKATLTDLICYPLYTPIRHFCNTLFR